MSHPFDIPQIQQGREGQIVVMNIIQKELTKAIEKYPLWPYNVFTGQNVVSEECGEAIKATLDYVQKPERSGIDEILKEHAQAAAMHIRQMQYLLKLRSEGV